MRGAGAPFAERLAELLPGLVEVESILTPMDGVQTCHLDLWSDNLRRTTVRRALRLRLRQRRTRPTPTRELAMMLFEFGQGDALRQRRLYDAYRAAGWTRAASPAGPTSR